MKSFLVEGKVWRWPGDIGWYFIYLPKDFVEKIKKVKNHAKGFVKIEARLGKSTWQTSLFPYTKEKTYLICIKKIIREKEGVFEGDKISLKIKLI